MTTKKRFRNKYRLELREDDHLPMHVHLVGGEIDVIIYLENLSFIGDFPRGLIEEVIEWITENRNEFIEEWKKWHP